MCFLHRLAGKGLDKHQRKGFECFFSRSLIAMLMKRRRWYHERRGQWGLGPAVLTFLLDVL